MRCYYIINWPYHESTAKDMPKRTPWAKDKVDFAGDDWRLVMDHRHAPEAILAYKVLRDLALLSPFRGLVLTHGSVVKPHDLDSICRKTGVKMRHLQRGLDVLTNVVRWVSSVECDGNYAALSRKLWGRVYCGKGVMTKTPQIPPGKPPENPPDIPPEPPEELGENSPEKPLLEEEGEEEGEREGEPAAPLSPAAPAGTENNDLTNGDLHGSPRRHGGTEKGGSGSPDLKSQISDLKSREAWEKLSPLGKMLAEGINWGRTNLATVADAAARLEREFGSNGSHAALEEGIAALARPGMKPWDVYGAFRQWNMERKRKQRAQEAAAKLRSEGKDAPSLSPEDRAKSDEMLRKILPTKAAEMAGKATA